MNICFLVCGEGKSKLEINRAPSRDKRELLSQIVYETNIQETEPTDR